MKKFDQNMPKQESTPPGPPDTTPPSANQQDPHLAPLPPQSTRKSEEPTPQNHTQKHPRISTESAPQKCPKVTKTESTPENPNHTTPPPTSPQNLQHPASLAPLPTQSTETSPETIPRNITKKTPRNLPRNDPQSFQNLPRPKSTLEDPPHTTPLRTNKKNLRNPTPITPQPMKNAAEMTPQILTQNPPKIYKESNTARTKKVRSTESMKSPESTKNEPTTTPRTSGTSQERNQQEEFSYSELRRNFITGPRVPPKTPPNFAAPGQKFKPSQTSQYSPSPTVTAAASATIGHQNFEISGGKLPPGQSGSESARKLASKTFEAT